MAQDQEQKRPQARPTSPHFQAYHLPLQALLSFGHRVSGTVLSISLFIIVAYVWIAAFMPDLFPVIQGLINTVIGRIVLFLWTGCYCYHLFTGTRHLIWDAGVGYEKRFYRASNWVLIFGVPLTTIVLFVISGGLK